MFLYFVINLFIEIIIYNYFERGYFKMEGDFVYIEIENVIKCLEIYSFKDWVFGNKNLN